LILAVIRSASPILYEFLGAFYPCRSLAKVVSGGLDASKKSSPFTTCSRNSGGCGVDGGAALECGPP